MCIRDRIDKILDVAEQKGTGKWTVAESVERGVYIPSIYEAQMARIFSTKKEERTYGAANLKYSSNEAPGLRTEEMEKALLLSMILAYSQGFELISKACLLYTSLQMWMTEKRHLTNVSGLLAITWIL